MFNSLMNENFESGVAQQLEGLQKLPWRLLTAVVAASFIVATMASISSGYFLLGKEKVVTTSSNLAVSEALPLNIPPATLSQAGIDLILKRNIFNSEGVVGEEKKDATSKDKSNVLVKSDLPVTLVGTIYGGTPFNGIAVIETTQKEKKVNTFQVGDLLLKEATLVEIYPEKVIVERLNGQREFIVLKQEELKVNKRRQKGGPKMDLANSLAPSGGGYATTPPPDSFKEDGFDRKGNEIQMNESYRDRLLTVDFAKVLQDAKAAPNIVDNQLKGFILTKIRKDSVYEKSGFMDGDVIEEINGVSLTDTAQTIKFLNALRGEKEIEVRFRRGGQVQNKTLNVR